MYTVRSKVYTVYTSLRNTRSIINIGRTVQHCIKTEYAYVPPCPSMNYWCRLIAGYRISHSLPTMYGGANTTYSVVQCTMCTVLRTFCMYDVHCVCTSYTVHIRCTLCMYVIHCACTTYSVRRTLYLIDYMYYVYCTTCSVPHTLYLIHCAFTTCTVPRIQYAYIYSILTVFLVRIAVTQMSSLYVL